MVLVVIEFETLEYVLVFGRLYATSMTRDYEAWVSAAFGAPSPGSLPRLFTVLVRAGPSRSCLFCTACQHACAHRILMSVLSIMCFSRRHAVRWLCCARFSLHQHGSARNCGSDVPVASKTTVRLAPVSRARSSATRRT